MSGCLSVRPSVTRQYYVETVKRVFNFKLFSPSRSYTILVFLYQTVKDQTVTIKKFTQLRIYDMVFSVHNYVVSCIEYHDR